MMRELMIKIGVVREIENDSSTFINDDKHKNDRPFDGLRVRVELDGDRPLKANQIPWAFPLLPKTIQTIPKIGEAVLVFYDGTPEGQRYYIGPIISQPQFMTYAKKDDATSLLVTNDTNPLERISNDPMTNGSFPRIGDVAIIGRGAEDIILRGNNVTKSSEIQLRAGVRGEPTNSDNPNMIGNIIFNGVDPAYIQLKRRANLTTKQGQGANSLINMVANRINIMSNYDDDVAHNLGDDRNMINDEKLDEIMEKLHPVPKGDKLVEFLELMKESLLNHVHQIPGKPQASDHGGFTPKLSTYPIKDILSEYVRIS